jgi:hypothetical protein
MRRMGGLVGGLLLLVTLATTPALTARAEDGSYPVEEERWWGVVGAAMWGGEMYLIRSAPAIGMNPYVLAAGIGGCLLAFLDAAT